jgi:hypothetical protein
MLALAPACSAGGLIELQIADPRLPFLEAGADFDALGIAASALSCPATDVRYPAQPLPATLVIAPGRCVHDRVELKASAYLGTLEVAASGSLAATFAPNGVTVVTATLSDLRAATD